MRTKALPPGWEWFDELWSKENLDRVAALLVGPTPLDDDVLLQEAYDSGYQEGLKDGRMARKAWDERV